MLSNGKEILILSTKETEKQLQSPESKVPHEGCRHMNKCGNHYFAGFM